MDSTLESVVPGRRAPAAGCAAGRAGEDVETVAALGAHVGGAGCRGQAGGAPPPPLAVHPSGNDVAAPATPSTAPIDVPAWHPAPNRTQEEASSWSRAGAGLPRTPSYPSTDPSSASATPSTVGGWLAGLKRALHKLKREVKALNYAVQVSWAGWVVAGVPCVFVLRGSSPSSRGQICAHLGLHLLAPTLHRTRVSASCPACWRCSPLPTC